MPAQSGGQARERCCRCYVQLRDWASLEQRHGSPLRAASRRAWLRVVRCQVNRCLQLQWWWLRQVNRCLRLQWWWLVMQGWCTGLGFRLRVRGLRRARLSLRPLDPRRGSSQRKGSGCSLRGSRRVNRPRSGLWDPPADEVR